MPDSRLGWVAHDNGRVEYAPVASLVGGVVSWDRESRLWLAGLKRYHVGRMPAPPSRSGRFETMEEAQLWVESMWERVLCKAGTN